MEEKFGQSQSQRDGASSLDLGGEEAVDEVLEEVEALMEEMEDVEMEVKAGDLYVSWYAELSDAILMNRILM